MRSRPTIAVLKEELEGAQKRLNDAQNAPWRDSEYLRLIEVAHARLDVARKGAEKRVEVIRAEIEDLKEQIQDAKAKAAKTRNSTWVHPDNWPDRLREFLKAISFGIDWGVCAWKKESKQNWQVRWMSYDERFVILTKPGRIHWSGVGQQSYGAADHWLLDLYRFTDAKKFRGRIGGGIALQNDCTIMEFEGGKLTRERRQQMIDKAKESARK